MDVHHLPTELYILFSDILCGAQHNHDIFPYFLTHARKVFPHLDCIDELKLISDLTNPPNWYPEARAINRKIIFHSGPTNSGKTYHALERFLSAKSGIYCGPLKLLAVEVFNKSKARGVPCDLVTGEERRCGREDGEPSGHVACTVEMANMGEPYEVCVIDEIQVGPFGLNIARITTISCYRLSRITSVGGLGPELCLVSRLRRFMYVGRGLLWIWSGRFAFLLGRRWRSEITRD